MKRKLKDILKYLEVSALQIEILEVLYDSQEDLRVKELCARLEHRGRNLYRPLDQLVKKDLIAKLSTRPAKYKARNLDIVLKAKLKEQYKQLSQFLPFLRKASLSEHQNIKILNTREEYRRFGLKRMRRVKEKVRLIVGGRRLSARFFKAHVDLLKRGIDIRFLINNPDTEAIDMYRNWVKNSFKVRLTNRSYVNIVIYDDREFQMAVKGRKNIREKAGVSVKDKILTCFLVDYFDLLWEGGRKVKGF